MIDQRDEYPLLLSAAFDDLSRLIVADETMQTSIDRLAQVAARAIDSADGCSLSVQRSGELENIAATSEEFAVIDEIQRQVGEGPCLSAIRQQRAFLINDMATDETWPRFSPRASQETGIQSMIAYVLEVHHEVLAAMNIMSFKKDAFTQTDVDEGVIFAAHAAVSLKNIQNHETLRVQVDQLEQGMRTRQMIGQALGIIMATRH